MISSCPCGTVCDSSKIAREISPITLGSVLSAGTNAAVVTPVPVPLPIPNNVQLITSVPTIPVGPVVHIVKLESNNNLVMKMHKEALVGEVHKFINAGSLGTNATFNIDFGENNIMQEFGNKNCRYLSISRGKVVSVIYLGDGLWIKEISENER